MLPKNILMIGPTGVGKTEIARRLAKLAGAPFLKVEATKFTEVGYVGRDVEQIVRDLVEVGIALVRESKRKEVQARAELAAEERVLDALVGAGAAPATREIVPPQAARRRARRQGDRDRGAGRRKRHADVRDSRHARRPDGRDVDRRHVRQGWAGAPSTRRTTVAEAYAPLIAEETDKLLDQDAIVQEAIRQVENNGIVFLDEIDKICAREGARGGDVSREGVQRDLLPLIEGTTVVDQARPGEDRPHPVHRLGRLPRRQALRPAAGAAGPPADPRRADAR